MKYNKVKDLNQEKFKRLTGVKKNTFDNMIQILRKQYLYDRRKGGRNRKLCMEDMLLMTLEYLREYRTYYHIAQNYDVSEGTAYKIIVWVENSLMKSEEFSLPKRKELAKSNNDIEVILVDATETQIQRPKRRKNQKETYSGKKNKIH